MDFGTWLVSCSVMWMDHHTQDDISIYIVTRDNDHFYIQDFSDKIKDVEKMPHYIKEDWINYNKKEITINIIDHVINLYRKNIKDWSDIEETMTLLKTLKRDIKLKSII